MAFEGNRHGKNCGRIVRQDREHQSTQYFIETCNRHWGERLDAAKAGTSNAWPMPMGHLMFSDFEHYHTAIA